MATLMREMIARIQVWSGLGLRGLAKEMGVSPTTLVKAGAQSHPKTKRLIEEWYVRAICRDDPPLLLKSLPYVGKASRL
jgi:hypothetical protein